MSEVERTKNNACNTCSDNQGATINNSVSQAEMAKERKDANESEAIEGCMLLHRRAHEKPVTTKDQYLHLIH